MTKSRDERWIARRGHTGGDGMVQGSIVPTGWVIDTYLRTRFARGATEDRNE